MLNEQFIKDDAKIDAVSLPQKECEKLIKEYIGVESLNYYQINFFINTLSGQLKKLSVNFPLTAANLIQNGNVLKKNLKKNACKFDEKFH